MSGADSASAETEALWNKSRVLFQRIDDTRADEESHLAAASSLHRQLHAAATADPANIDLYKWEDLLSLYSKTLSSVHSELQYLDKAQDAMGNMFSMLYPEAPQSLARRERASSKNVKRKADVKKPKMCAEIAFPVALFGLPGSSGILSDTCAVNTWNRKFPPIPIIVGADVAVRTQVPDVGDAWIWARVTSIKHSMYEVEDVEDKCLYTVSESDIIPLTPANYPDFPVGHTVMACYPETTAFYKAIVVQAPPKGSEYHIQFYDDNGVPSRPVPKSHVTQYITEKIERI